MKRPVLFYILFFCISTMTLSAENSTKVIAHRGFWDCEGSAQNSLAALKKAAEIGVYGSEFDVIVTADGIPVVNHDEKIGGMLIEATPYLTIKDIKLTNGEKLPTLEVFLEEAKKLHGIRLFLEIKPHSTSEKESRAVEIITALVDSMDMAYRTEYISFSKHIVQEIARRVKKAEIAYLNGDLSPKRLKEMGCTGLDYHHRKLHWRPWLIKQAKEEGLTINSWTVNSSLMMRWLINKKADYITTDKPLKLQEVLKNK